MLRSSNFPEFKILLVLKFVMLFFTVYCSLFTFDLSLLSVMEMFDYCIVPKLRRQQNKRQ